MDNNSVILIGVKPSAGLQVKHKVQAWVYSMDFTIVGTGTLLN